eukprot:Nitzschia sp. Nitz4//scaffold22_size323478//27667//29477//NITZ4_000496-RA/size323478-augustus-gene-0.222-mRNA-1//-1//CDS//3329542902//2949//frame0
MTKNIITTMMEEDYEQEGGGAPPVVSSPTSVMVITAPKTPVDMVLDKVNNTSDGAAASTTPPAWNIPASAKSARTTNPLRVIVDPILENLVPREDGKEMISLALGDPTVGGNLPPCPKAIRTIVDTVQSPPHAAGYVYACGTSAAREAIAQYHSRPEHSFDAANVVIANGCSGALELALTALLDPGSILLVPQPGFPLYQSIAEAHGASVQFYPLNPNRQWELDLDYLESFLRQHRFSQDIRGIVVNNPSNPTGAVYSKTHLQQILHLCSRYKLPVLADEVYGDLTYGDHVYHPMAQMAAQLGREVPIITVSGLAKQFLLPGWRLGWILFQDNLHGSLANVEAGAKRLAGLILGASHLVQTVIPTLLDRSNEDMVVWKKELRNKLARQAKCITDRLSTCPGLDVSVPQGAMYSMIRIQTGALDIQSDIEFSSLLLKEQNVFVLPGTAFGFPNTFRVVFCASECMLEDAANRIAEFCQNHTKVVGHLD